MTYTVTITTHLPEGQTANTEAEWDAILDACYTQTFRDSVDAIRGANPDLISLTYQYNGDSVVRIWVWTDEAAWETHKTAPHAAELNDIIAAMSADGFTRTYNKV